MTDPVSNAPALSVSELAGALKRTIEDAFGLVRLRGEISGYRGPHGSGHVYFSLKDANAKIDAVIWKGVFSRLTFRPEDGLGVIATGKITTFAGKSSYQIIIEAMEPAGVGALMALLEARKQKLATEGLFDAARKKPLPAMPRVIGVVTSPTGAVIRDILHRLADRFPCHVLLWPVRVQGEGSAAEVAAAIHGFNALDQGGAIPRPDVIIVARGGGSLEDLWSFNEESVVRAASMSALPLISAIGHETDWTLLDLVADFRAPTPTAAAERAVPVRADLLAALRERAARLTSASLRLQERRRRDVMALIRALPDAQGLLATPRQRLDIASVKRMALWREGRDQKVLKLATLARRLDAQRPAARLARIGERLMGLAQRLTQARATRISFALREEAAKKAALAALTPRLARAPHEALRRQQQRLGALSQVLASLGYQNVLARGFVLVKDRTGKPLRSAAMVETGQHLALYFADGAVSAIAGDGSPAPRKSARVAVKDQGSLF